MDRGRDPGPAGAHLRAQELHLAARRARARHGRRREVRRRDRRRRHPRHSRGRTVRRARRRSPRETSTATAWTSCSSRPGHRARTSIASREAWCATSRRARSSRSRAAPRTPPSPTYDNDGWLDLFVIGGDGRGLLYRNDGKGAFAELATRGDPRREGRAQGAVRRSRSRRRPRPPARRKRRPYACTATTSTAPSPKPRRRSVSPAPATRAMPRSRTSTTTDASTSSSPVRRASRCSATVGRSASPT